MSDSKRPTPLSEDLFEPGVPPATGTTLLGRTNGASGVGGFAGGAGAVKKPSVDAQAAATHARTPLTMTPKNLLCFTPIATPSPTAHLGRCFSGAQPVTPGGAAPPKPQPPLGTESRGSAATPPPPVQQQQQQHFAEPPPPPAQAAPLRQREQPGWGPGEAHRRLEGTPAPARQSTTVSLEQALMGPSGPERRVPPSHQQQPEEDDEEEEDDDDDGEEQPAGFLVKQPANVPQPPPGAQHPSIGSEGHALGACKRCCFFPRGRCMNGYDCQFCHYEHEKRKRKNKKKSKRAVPNISSRMSMLSAGRPAFVPGQLMHPTAQTMVMLPTGHHGGVPGAHQHAQLHGQHHGQHHGHLAASLGSAAGSSGGMFGAAQSLGLHQLQLRQAGPNGAPMVQVVPQQCYVALGGGNQMGGVPMPHAQAQPSPAEWLSQPQAPMQPMQQMAGTTHAPMMQTQGACSGSGSSVIALEPATMHGAGGLPATGIAAGMHASGGLPASGMHAAGGLPATGIASGMLFGMQQGYLDVPPPPTQSPRIRR